MAEKERDPQDQAGPPVSHERLQDPVETGTAPAEVPDPAEAPAPPARGWAPPRRGWRATALIAAVAVAGALLALYAWDRRRSTQPNRVPTTPTCGARPP